MRSSVWDDLDSRKKDGDGYIPPKRLFPEINKKSRFYKNCKRQRKLEAKICKDCPFRKGIEEQEQGV